MKWVTVSLLPAAFICGLSSAGAQTQETVTYYHTDAIGSVRMTTDAAQQVVARYDYLPFGEPWIPPQPPNVRQYAGKEHDTESGFDYFGARYYSSGNGRFTTVDPVLDVDQALVDPQRWNRYTYALNRPYRYVDPDGANPVLIKLLELAQRAASSPAAQRTQQALANQGARAWVALTRLFNTPAGQEAIETASELLTGADLGPTAGAARSGIGAVIGHYDAGYAKVGRDLRVAVFDVPKEIWDRLTPEQRTRANQAFLNGVIERGLAIKVVTNGPVRIPSILAWEIDYLLGKGYKWSDAGDTLLPPNY
jgi:RHS repeat-associated protein